MPRVLLLDDDSAVAKAHARMLEQAGLGRIEVCSSPKEALARLNVAAGDALYLSETTDSGFRLTASNPDFARKMQVADNLSRRYRHALKELAK